MFGSAIESRLLSFEDKRGKFLAGLVVALILMVIAVFYVRPAVHTVVLGNAYAVLSMNPFTEEANAVGYRILTPLIGYLLGLRGQGIIFTNLIFALGFLALIYWYFRNNLSQLSDALYGTTVFAFSLVTLTTIYYGGYCDSLTYVLILLMWIFRSKIPLVGLFFFLGLLNRESIIFLVPWFAFIHWTESSDKMKTVLKVIFWYGLALGIYYLFRLWISSFREISFTAGYYLDVLFGDTFSVYKKSYGYQSLGLFSVFKASWIIVLLAVWSYLKQKQMRNIVSIAILICCVWAQMVIAWDSSRLMTMVFPIMVISLLQVLKDNPFDFRKWAVPLLVFNLFVPKMYTAAQIIEFMNSSFTNLFEIVFLGKSGW